MEIRFDDHAPFHRAAIATVATSATFAMALHPIAPSIAPLAGGVLGIGAGAAIAYGKPWRAVVAGLATLPLFLMAPTWSSLIAAGAIASVASVIGLRGARGARGLAALAFGAAVAVLAMWCAVRISHAQRTATWPALVTDGVAGAAMGIVAVLATLPRHLRFATDPIATARRALPATLDAEVRELCDRAAAIWTTAKPRLADGDAALVRDGVLKTFEVATRSQSAKVSGEGDEALAARIAELDKRIAASTDSEARSQYESARAALEDQRRYRERIRAGRERVVARMHHHVAALEKYQLAATDLLAESRGTPAMKQLEALSQDVAASGEALAEVAAN